MGYSDICDNDQREQIIAQAVASVGARHSANPLFRRELELFSEEIRWINHDGIESEGEYVAAERIGRSQARLTRRERPAMYEVYREYLELGSNGHGKRYDWDDMALAVRRELERDDDDGYYRRVVIDEGQDFSPEMVRSLALAVPEDGSLTMFADVAQQIYGRRISWSDAGLDVDEVWRFERNYRNSPQIANLGLAIAAMPYYAGEPDMVEPTEFAAEGPGEHVGRDSDPPAIPA